jgi:hypothetical protein
LSLDTVDCQAHELRRLKCNRRRDIYDVTQLKSGFEEGYVGKQGEMGIFSGGV